MKVVTPLQMKEIDAYTINEIGIPGIVLMENAANGVAVHINSFFHSVKAKNITVLSGNGNNGGDGFAVARLLHNQGYNVYVYIIGYKHNINGDALTNLKILKKVKIPVEFIHDESDFNQLDKCIFNSDLVVDAMLGTGIRGQVKSTTARVIDIINNRGKYIVSVDIPSGIDGETGEVCGTAIRANQTITFGLPKIGHIVYPGKEYTGHLDIVDISIPNQVIDKMDIGVSLITKETVSSFLPERTSQSHKGDYGRVVIVGGTLGMTGAPVLAAQAANRTGAGLVTVAISEGLHNIIEVKLTEVMSKPLKEDHKGILSIDSIPEILDILKNASVLAFGPGIGQYKQNINILRNILEQINIPIIIDADGLNILANEVGMLKQMKNKVIITPHPGEMARLTGKTVEEIQKNRIKTALEFSEKEHVITVLKGANTVVADVNGDIFINPTGNPGMATGGTGDVLTGIIAGFIAQGLEPLKAAIAGAYIHGLAGDMMAEQKGIHGIIAGDIVEALPYAIKKVKEVVNIEGCNHS